MTVDSVRRASRDQTKPPPHMSRLVTGSRRQAGHIATRVNCGMQAANDSSDMCYVMALLVSREQQWQP